MPDNGHPTPTKYSPPVITTIELAIIERLRSLRSAPNVFQTVTQDQINVLLRLRQLQQEGKSLAVIEFREGRMHCRDVGQREG